MNVHYNPVISWAHFTICVNLQTRHLEVYHNDHPGRYGLRGGSLREYSLLTTTPESCRHLLARDSSVLM